MNINKEWILIFKKQLDRINRIIRIKRPSAEGPLAAGAKNLYPVKFRRTAQRILNSKNQITNNKQITMTKIRNPKPVYDLEERGFQMN